MTDATKTCPACLSTINAAATRCPSCTERQPDAPGLHRDVPERVFGGVCAAIARRFSVDVTLVRILAVASLAVTGPLIFWVYPAVWLMTPYELNGRAPLTRFFDALARIFNPQTQTPRLEQQPTRVE
jgi:phage shock protein PspC (stress-responsive transcriptional regulator)